MPSHERCDDSKLKPHKLSAPLEPKPRAPNDAYQLHRAAKENVAGIMGATQTMIRNRINGKRKRNFYAMSTCRVICDRSKSSLDATENIA